MALPTCTTGRHSSEEAPTPVPEPVQTAAPTETKSGVETYGTAPSPAPAPQTAPAPPPKEVKEEEDDLSIPVPAGTKCKRLACGAEYVGEASRGDGPEGVCTYHPQNVSVALGVFDRSLCSTKDRRGISAASAECSSSPSSSRSPGARLASIFLLGRRKRAKMRRWSTAALIITRRR